MRGLIKGKIRVKLVLSLLAVVVITGIGSIFISLNVINKNVLGQAREEVRTNLNTAQHIYNERINVIYLFMKHLASLNYIQNAILSNDRILLVKKLKEVREELNIDILNITDAQGRVIVRAGNSEVYGDDASGIDFLRFVLENKEPCSGASIMKHEYIAREGEKLAKQAFIQVIPTPMARDKNMKFEDSGMVLMGAAPIFSGNRFIGVVYGARLLNNNFELVDRIKNLVFRDERIGGYDIGTVTIFMDDLRISTNVKKMDGSRAIGTQVSEEVYKKVIEHREIWLDNAFVVNNWYISSYGPIYNIDKKVIGILYVGILEEKYNIIKRDATIYSLLVTIVTAMVAVLLSVYLIRNIITPIRALVTASNEIAMGIYTKKLEVNTKDEVGYLCSTFNKMIDAIDERDKKLKEQTERQIVQSEKLASLGRLASGIAHEINNPLTGVLSYSTALLDDLKGTQYQEDMQTIIDETLRCREIVKGILDFARETKTEKKPGDINRLINDTFSILEKHVNFQNITIVKDLARDIPAMNMDANQIRSVINNLAVNAADAMQEGGELTISTRYESENETVIIEVKDTGIGISEENINKIFDPFYTTKETGKGTGLGLSVTYGIIKRHNGYIEVKSTIGMGTCFIMKFPVSG